MSEPFLAEIRIVGFNFPPRGWASCDGQLLPISQNTALFALIGTYYGGDGRVTFGLPNLQGSAPLHPGNGPGLTPRNLGEQSGSQSVTLLQTEMPAHTHVPQASANAATQADPTNGVWAKGGQVRGGAPLYNADLSAPVAMSPQALAPAGGSQPHNNLPPYLVLNFVIALAGIFPQRP
jgi:microcystin-dependent protein